MYDARVSFTPVIYKQLTGEKHLRADMPAATKLEDGDEVTEEILQESLRRALGWMSALQAEDGHWPGDYSGIMNLLPFWVRINSIPILRLISIISPSTYMHLLLTYVCSTTEKGARKALL